MGYENADTEVFDFNWDQSGGSETRTIKPPVGKGGMVMDITASVTTTFTSAGTDALISVGVVGTIAKFGTLNMLVAIAGVNVRGTLTNVLVGVDEEILLTFAQGDTTPVGIADVQIKTKFFAGV